MISPTRNVRLSGNFVRVSYAYSTARSTPQQKPDSRAEPKRGIADRERVSGPADRVHDLAVIVGRERAFNGALEPEAFAEIGLFHGTQSNRTPRPPRTASST